MNYGIFSLVVFELILENYLISCDVESDILNYYDSETIKSFQKQWETVRKSYENALKIALIENFGRKSMNTIERKTDKTLAISKGFYLYDNVVHMVFHGLCLKDMPRVKNPDMYFPLANNVLQLQTELSKMIVETKYSLMRNNTDVLFAGTNFDPNSNSPFALQQVQDIGSLAILVEDCLLSGFVITKLIGQTIILGHDTFKISDCKFTIEISAEGLGAPPVIAPYFSIEQRGLLEDLMAKPIQEELRSKLQAALYTYVNTSIFEDDLLKFRKKQQMLFKETSKYIIDYIREGNKEKMKTDKAAYDLGPLDIIWNATINGVSQVRSIKLNNVIIDGFDSAYSPLIGGPYKLQNIGIAETQRYNTLKVQGKIFFESNNFQTEHDFSMELLDVNVNINKNVEDKSQIFTADSNAFWGDTAFSITNVENDNQRITAESIANGYLINEIPKLLTSNILKLKNLKSEGALSQIRDKNQGLEQLSDISEENGHVDYATTIQHSNEKLNKVDVGTSMTFEDNDVNYLSQEVVKVSLLLSNQKSSEENTHIDPKAANLDDENISNYEEGRRKHRQKNKKHKRHGKRHQDKSTRTKKEYKQKKKIHYN